MIRQNFKRHLAKCVFKNEVGVPRTEIENMKKSYRPSEIDDTIKIAFTELKQYLTDNYMKATSLHKRLISTDSRDPIARLKELHVSEPTKRNNIQEWNLFSKWLKKNSKLPDKESGDSYLSTLKCRASTLKKKHYMLQNILQFLIDPGIKLNRVNMRISYIPKYAMSDEEIQQYLEEQEKVDFHDYVIQKLMITYGLRVNSVASLRLGHLEFLEKNNQKIVIPDSKVKNQRYENLNPDLEKELESLVENESDNEVFVFYPNLHKKDERKRAHEFCLRINKRIKTSKILKANKNFKFTSHMFRKTKAFNLFQKGINELKAKAREAIGQSQNSTAIESYIH